MQSLWENGLLDQLSYASVLLPPLAVSLTFLALGYVHCFPQSTILIPRSVPHTLFRLATNISLGPKKESSLLHLYDLTQGPEG